MSIDRVSSRRSWLSFASRGLGSIALADLLIRDNKVIADRVAAEAADPAPHFPPRATRVIHICGFGGISQVDSFDYKPELEKLHGKTLASDQKGI